jgi:DNA (cytosine-5)-methyltransferase 1
MEHPMTITNTVFYAGAGGDSQGTEEVPEVRNTLAANHWDRAIETHSRNFPDTDHFQGDIHDADVARFPRTDMFWASPECPTWSQARGKERDFAKQPDLFGETLTDAAADRSRALMWDVPRYLGAMQDHYGRPVLAGVVENVVDVRDWIHWHEWVGSIRNLGYKTKLIAINSMHAQPVRTPAAPQSRDRLYLAYWHTSLGRDPDWDKWLRPRAWCPVCDAEIRAIQVWKKWDTDMGRYRQQYVYRCPHLTCRNEIVEPYVLPALAAIDWADLGTRIGDRTRPMKPATRARIAAGLRKYARPITLEAAGNTFERRPGVRTWPVDAPFTAQTTTATKGIACPPMVVPAGGTWRQGVTTADQPFPARTTRENDGVAVPPFLVPIRSGRPRTIQVTDPMATVVADGSGHGLAIPPLMVVLRNNMDCRPLSEALTTVSTSGAHHGLAIPPGAMIMRNNGSRGDGGEHCTPVGEPLRTLTSAGHQSVVTWPLLVQYYGNGTAGPVTVPVGTLSTRDRYGLATGTQGIPGTDVIEINPEAIDQYVDDCLFRMLKPPEIGLAMAFFPTYVVLGNQREQVRQYGNAVTPPVAEVLYSALVEAITGEPLERELQAA